MTLHEAFDRFSRLKVLIVGDVMLDSYIWGSVDRISPEAPVPVVSVKKKDYRLGGAANVALNVQSLGAQPMLCALAGADDTARKLRECFQRLSISDEGIVISTERPTTEKIRIIASHQHVVRVDEEADRVASEAESTQLWKQVRRLLPLCDVVIFEDYDKGVITPSLIDNTVRLAKELNKPIIVDPKKRNFLAYKGVTLFKPNLKELREGLKVEVEASHQGQVMAAVELLKQRLQLGGVLTTLSEFGVYIDFQSEQIALPAHTREIADVSGAGDTVVAIASLCLALGLTPRQVAQLSNLGGGLVCQYVGVVPINKDELYREALKEGF
jgi:rfaE bifunctional protein kinase chain/domain